MPYASHARKVRRLMKSLRLDPIEGLPEIRPGDDLAGMLAARLPDTGDPGVLVVAQKVISKAENRIVRLADVKPSVQAIELAPKIPGRSLLIAPM